MKPIHLTVLKFTFSLILILLLLLLTLPSLATARPTNSHHPTQLTINALHPRGTDADPTPSTFICTTTKSSPFKNHVLFGAEEMQQTQGNHWCTQDSREEKGCMELINYGSALVMMCGEYRTKLRCYHLVNAINDLARACTRDTGTVGGQLRLSGRAVFDWGYLEVMNK